LTIRDMAIAAAKAALAAKADEGGDLPERAASSNMTQRELAMANLNRKGVVSAREARGEKGPSQHSDAMKKFQTDDAPARAQSFRPNWKLSAAEKKAHEEKMALRGKGGQSQLSAAMANLQGKLGEEQAAAGDKPFKAPSKPVGGFSGHTPAAWSKPATSSPGWAAGNKSEISSPAPPPSGGVGGGVVQSGGGGGGSAAEAVEGVEKDLKLLVAGIKRLVVTEGKGTQEADGGLQTTFGVLVNDEELEQTLESLVGTLKAGRKRGVLAWEGQMLLMGPHSGVPIKLLSTSKEAEETPAEIS